MNRSLPRISVAILAVLLLAAVLVPWISPYDYYTPAWDHTDLSPALTSGHLLGTDALGRDLLVRLMWSTRISLLVALAASLISLTIGVSWGVAAGYLGGRTDAFIMRIADIQLSFPAILIALLVFGVARGLIAPQYHEQAAIIVLIVAIGLSNWASYARTVRGSTLVEKNKDYVLAARVMGRSMPAIMGEHVLPNVIGPVLVIATINLALAIIAESTLSFLGVGVPPTQPSLGTLIRVGQQFLFSGEWWILFYPALDLVLLALSINLLGDWLRDALNPKLR